MDDISTLLNVLDKLSTLGFLAIAVWAFLTEKIVPKGRLDDQKAQTREAIDGWQDLRKSVDRLADAWEARNEAEERRNTR